MTQNTLQTDINSRIDKIVKSDDIVLFMKGVPDIPQCGFSSMVVKILDHLGVTYSAVDVLADQELREGIKTYSDWPTIPQLYVRGQFTGGCDIIRDMFEKGELRTLLADSKVTDNEQ